MKLKENLTINYIRAKMKLLSLVSKRKAAEKIFNLFCTPFIKPADRQTAIFSSAEILNFNVDGLRLQGYRWNKDKPYKILILHGFGSAAHNFHQYVSGFAGKGYQVLAVDAPAHGSSEGSTINAMQYCQVIGEIIKVYGPINGFLAHSLGGLALSLALENVATDKNTKVVFIAPATETVTAINDAFKFLQINDEGIRKEFDNIIFDISGHATEWFSMKRALENCKADILWIHDEDDDVTPLKDALLVKAAAHKNINFVITKGLGHRKIYRDAAIKNMVEDFL